VRHAHDRRRFVVELTPQGEAYVVEGQKPLLATLAQVDGNDLAQVSSWLGVIAGELHAQVR